ncbi:T9SS type A sorting domain-containing protein [Bacteroidia bacterium]|nr:T9SS type A sorting domain-containing protein [Bacteroidia bacterium]
MKRVLLSAISAMFIISSAFSQSCNPDITITEPGVYPEQPDKAYADQFYEFVFQILAIRDTTVEFGGQRVTANIDSVKVNDVIGLPSGFNYACEPSRCTFDHTAVGCIKLFGNPTQAQAGVYSIKIATTAYASLGLLQVPTPDTADGYELIIEGDGSASIFKAENFEISVYPNPSSLGFYTLNSRAKVTNLSIKNLQGKNVSYIQTGENGLTYLDLSTNPRGVYFLSIYAENRVSTIKIIY